MDQTEAWEQNATILAHTKPLSKELLEKIEALLESHSKLKIIPDINVSFATIAHKYTHPYMLVDKETVGESRRIGAKCQSDNECFRVQWPCRVT